MLVVGELCLISKTIRNLLILSRDTGNDLIIFQDLEKECHSCLLDSDKGTAVGKLTLLAFPTGVKTGHSFGH